MSTTGIPAPPPPAPTPGAGGPPKRLVRLTDQGKVAGVAAGIGWYLGIDPTLIRIGLIVLTLTTGIGIPLYAVAWWLMPASTATQTTLSAPTRARDGRSLLIAAVAIIAVTGLLGQIDVFGGRTVLAATLIGLGILLFNDDKPRHQPRQPHANQPGVPVANPWTTPPPAPPPSPALPVAGPHSSTRPATPPQPVAPPPAAGPGGPATPPQPQSAYEPYAGAWTKDAKTHRDGSKRPKSYLGRLTFGVWIVAVSLAVLLWSLGVITLGARGLLGITIAVAGVGLLVGTFFGRARGLIVVGLLASGALLISNAIAASDITLGSGVGETRAAAADVSELQPSYNWTIGENRLDLSDLELDGAEADVMASIVVGELRVTVPDDVTVFVNGSLGAGQVSVLGEQYEGTDLEIDADDEVPSADGILRLDVSGLIGEITVDRQSQGTLVEPQTSGSADVPEPPGAEGAEPRDAPEPPAAPAAPGATQ
ncbi:PspC domain-containing protein [Euzebya tangerina]|uniref:PspC domain-containing protein n=1 Tax=Euzebya tangerina TaxID=591198 RepID=UPI0013C2BDF0|nr:PspC domain-containing protein [Euzebya tangerina]